ncbi:hypothetical protein CIL05_14440 [Virgibacillus profundi]|uniref:Peptidoglycan binding domain-containing protein n=1 Tax=Virgibacillus profundi TaxID=2024555 RepID=A0A2A2IB71_9BACI|nr:VanW family protein [Virgibacillus profundi]PAV28822.1 hypothetical protein CIL05_14440 [Virgibacillus profundi]PXY52990.1 hypothetical protein CIT14_14565 [Virgibacillus profundi]
MKVTALIFLLLFIPMNPIFAEVDFNDNKIMLDKLEIKQYSLPYMDGLFIDEKKLTFLMDILKEKIYKNPQNASLDKNGEIVKGKPGVTIDRDKFNVLFRKMFYSNSDMKLEVPKKLIYPRVDNALLEEIRAKELGSYVTYFKKSNLERSHNIALATEAINNYVVFPGETFSFNEIVGERTKEKGYKRAPVIVKGELAEDIGGGICQVSSTLFNAVDLKGIQIIERYEHSKRVPYVPPGRDATVSWWGPDFVFKNIYNQPVLVRAKSDHGKMLVSIYSSEDVEYFSGE